MGEWYNIGMKDQESVNLEQSKADTEETGLKRDEKGRFLEGSKPPAGFDKYPENRSPGGWKKEDSISYQYNKLIRLTEKQLLSWLEDNPEDKRTVAQMIALEAVKKARKQLDYLKEITDRTEGKAPQTVIYEGGLFTNTKLEVEVVDEDKAKPEADSVS